MASISKGKNGSGTYWDVRWRDPVTGRQRRKRTRTKAMADKWHAYALSVEAHGVELASQRAADVSLGWVIDRWWEWKYDRIAPTTRSSWEAALKHVPTAIRKRPIRSLTTPEVESILDDAARNGGYEMAKKVRTVLSNIAKYAMKHSYLTSNPVAAADTPKPARTQGATKRSTVDPKEVPHPNDVWRLAEEVPPVYRALVLVLGIAGLRLGEALGLKVEDVDLEAGTLTVARQQSQAPARHSYSGKARELTDPKSSSSFRTIPLPPDLIAALEDHITQHRPKGGRLFVTHTGATIQPGNFRNRVFGPAVQKAGIKVRCTPHTLRHVCASILIRSGLSPAKVAEYLGHANAGVVLTIYAGFYRADDDAVVEALQEAMSRTP